MQKDFIPTKYKILGITPSQIAKRLGLATGVTAGAAGAVGIYNWFADNDPDKTALVSKNISRTKFKASGNAAEIEKQATASLNRITQISTKTSQLMRTNPEAAVGFYTENISKELTVLSGVIDQWDVVVENSDNPAAAEQAGRNIARFADNLANKIAGLAGQVGVDLKGKATKTHKTDPNIAKIQGALKLEATGVLDRQTISALRDLENKFNAKSKDNEFTGAFVVPEIGFVVEYKNLIEAFNRVKNY